MAVLESCPKHNMVAYLEKTAGNAEFHEVIGFSCAKLHSSQCSSLIKHLDAKKQLMNVPVPLDHFPINALTSKVFSFMVKKSKHFSGKVTPLFASMLVQPTEDEGVTSERPSELQPIPSPPHPSEANVEPQPDPSPRPSPSIHIPDSIPESSGGNHGGQSSSDKSLLGNEGDMTLQSVYDLCISLCTQVTDQAKEIKHLKAQLKKLQKKAKPVITHHKAWMKSVSLKKRLARKKSNVSVSKQGRKSTKAETSVHKDPLFDELPDENNYTEDELSTAQQKVSTDRPNVSTDRPKVNTDKEKDSTVSPDEGTDDRTDERSATLTTTPTMFRDDETIAQTERPRPTSTRSLLTLKPLPKIDPKDKGKIKNEDEDEYLILNLKVQEDWEAEEEVKKLAEEEAIKTALSNEYDFIQARIEADRLLALRLQDKERESSSLWKKEQSSFMIQLHLKEGFLQNKELLQSGINLLQELTLYEKVKRFDESFTAVGSTEDERRIKEMNEGVKDPDQKSLKKRVVEETPKTEDTAKIVTFEGTMDSEVMERKSVIARLDKIMKNPHKKRMIKVKFVWDDPQDWRCHLEIDLLQRMLDLGLEVERESTIAFDLIRFIKQQIGCKDLFSLGLTKDIDEIKTINIELEHRVAKLIAENEHLKQTYKQLYDSIEPSCVRAKEHAESLVNQLNQKKIKGKDIVDNAAQVSNATTIAPGMYKLDPAMITKTHLDKCNLYSTCKYVKLIQELLGYVRDTFLDIHKPRVSRSTKSSRSKSTDNTKNDRILQISSSTQKKNKVEDHSRIVKSCLNKPNCVVEPSGNANVQHSKLNTNSELMCVKCNSSMFDARHELCFLEFVSDMNASSKSKSVKKAKKKEEWKPTGKVFTKIGYNWRPTGRTFTLVGNACPLTRITATNKVPLREPIPLEVVAQESVVTKVYTRRPKVVQIVLWYLDSGCSKHMTRDRSQLTNFVHKFLGTVKFDNDQIAKIMRYDLEVAFRKHTCFVHNLEGVYLLSGSQETNLYTLSIGDMMASSPICLLSKASKTKSWLWHRRLSHLNFGAINHLAKNGLVRGLPKLKFEKDYLCSACAMSKSKKQSHKPKSKDTNQEKLYLLHIDLSGPMRVASINEKKYILIIGDDYSRFTWVKFLASKDEALDFIIKFLKMIQVRLNTPARNIRTDNGTEFVNQTLDDDEPQNEGPNEGEGATTEEPVVEYFDTFSTRDELTYHRYQMSGPIPSIFLRNPVITEGCPYNLKIPCNIGHVHIKKAYINLNSPLNIMTRMMYNWIMRRKLDPRENASRISNFTGRIKRMHVFVGNFTYVIDFMIVEDISSIIDPRLSQVVLGGPFVEISNMTHDPPKGVVRFIRGADEVVYKMPHKIEQYDSFLDLKKEHTKSVYLRNKEDKKRGVEYVMSKILGFYKEFLELGPEYLTGMDDDGEVN
ncbi:retrovirus-related pol polyprotein from transposon TNT 1-94 [Tanacetum coccineum]